MLTLSPDVTGEYSAVEIAMARVPFNEAATITPATLHIVREAKYALASSGVGAPQTKIQGSWASFDELGNPVYDKTFWQTETEAGSTTLDNDEPVIAIAARSVNTQAATVSLNLEITYHMEFFDLHIDDDQALQLSAPSTLVQKSKGKTPLAGKSKPYVPPELDSFADDSEMDCPKPRKRT